MKLFTLILSAAFLAISSAASIHQPLQHIQPVAPLDPTVRADVGEVIKDVIGDVAETVVDIQAGEKVNPADLLDTVQDAKADIAEIVAESLPVTTEAPTDVIDAIEDALEDAADNMDDARDAVQDAQEDAVDNVADIIDAVQDAQEDAADNMDDARDAVQDAQEDAADNMDDAMDTVQDAQEDTVDNMADLIETVQDAQEDAAGTMADAADTVQDAQEDAADNMADLIETVQDAQEDAADNMIDAETTEPLENSILEEIIDNILDVEPKDKVEEIMKELKEIAEKDDADVIDKIDIENLTDEEVRSLVNADQEQLVGFLDVYLGANELQKKNSSPVRRKRWIPVITAVGRVAFAGGRALFKRFASKGITRSGDRITKHYSRPGNYFSGLREFKNLNPTNVKKIGGSKFNGWTGTSGPYRVTVRSGSKGTTGSNGSPTLSISSKGGKLVRKFRFDRK